MINKRTLSTLLVFIIFFLVFFIRTPMFSNAISRIYTPTITLERLNLIYQARCKKEPNFKNEDAQNNYFSKLFKSTMVKVLHQKDGNLSLSLPPIFTYIPNIPKNNQDPSRLNNVCWKLEITDAVSAKKKKAVFLDKYGIYEVYNIN